MRFISNIPVFGTSADEGAVKQIEVCAKTAEYCALMADHHKGYAVPIGGVVAYKDAISPSGVGYDIGCGNKAVRLELDAKGVFNVKSNISLFMDLIWKQISFGIGRKNYTPVEHPIFDNDQWCIEANRDLKKTAQDQLGTVGSGNHYVDIFEDEQGRIWVGCHFGSRGLGHKTATWFLNAGGAKDDMDAAPMVLPVNSDLGQQYLIGMDLAGGYARAGRDWVCQKVAQILGGEIVEEVHNHHNFAWLESHNGESLWVVRKGATPAFPGQRGFVGGTMAENAVILEGVESPLSSYTLYSTVHGAGRVMGRRMAAGKRNRKTGQIVTPGLVTPDMMREWVEKAGIELRGAGLDESPDCYKRLPEVLTAMGDSVRVLHTLKPLGVAMAGPDVHDPYKD